ncbi:MAG: nicotinate (nicotinamide) nucleotide adenylyltransferase [Clostridiales bacterium]|nr:nicotinate (nicotinamide) nucleotide adenylyltransferase [Clostridiales bacterium]
MKLGIYGGTFSPVHNGHIGAARAFVREMKLDKLMIIPAFIPPHKAGNGILSPDIRLELCRLAFDGEEKTEVSDIEISRGGKSYTCDTVCELLSRGYDDITLLCGTDMLLDFDKWYRFDKIHSLCSLAYAKRETSDALSARVREKADHLRNTYGARISELDIVPNEISSTEIRKMLSRGDDVTALIPQKEYEYIKKNGIYTNV